jgi:hypothetical protein
MKNKPKVDQILFSLNVGNAARRGREQKLTPVIVTQIGRKYFTARPTDGREWYKQYSIEDWKEKTDISPVSELFETEQDWENEKVRCNIIKKLSKEFDFGSSRFSFEQLKAVDEILFPKGVDDAK